MPTTSFPVPVSSLPFAVRLLSGHRRPRPRLLPSLRRPPPSRPWNPSAAALERVPPVPVDQNRPPPFASSLRPRLLLPRPPPQLAARYCSGGLDRRRDLLPRWNRLRPAAQPGPGCCSSKSSDYAWLFNQILVLPRNWSILSRKIMLIVVVAQFRDGG
jgi:hypothetical protein